MGVGQKRPWNAMLCTVNAHLALRYLPWGRYTLLIITGTRPECQSLATKHTSSP